MKTWKFNGTEIIQEGSGARIALMLDGWPKQDIQANARLIAAAPDMYEAIKTAISELNDAQGEWAAVTEIFAPTWTHLIKSAISQLEEALTKAEGK